MRNPKLLGIVLAVAALFQAACAEQNNIEIASIETGKLSDMSTATDDRDKTPVLVELFTSEG